MNCQTYFLYSFNLWLLYSWVAITPEKWLKLQYCIHRLSYNKQYRWLTIMLYIVIVIGFKNHIPVKKRLPVRLTRTVDQELQTLHIINNWLSYPWDFFPLEFYFFYVSLYIFLDTLSFRHHFVCDHEKMKYTKKTIFPIISIPNNAKSHSSYTLHLRIWKTSRSNLNIHLFFTK